MQEELQEKHNVPVLPINIDTMTEKDMYNILMVFRPPSLVSTDGDLQFQVSEDSES